MAQLANSPYVEMREGGYYIAGTRIGLDVLVRDFQEGKSPEAIWRAYPSIGSLAKVYGAITVLLEHPEAVRQYLEHQDRLWGELREQHPLPPEMLERFQRARELLRDPA
jgi:uncharacterized protein (DUF433 family)